MGRWPSCEFFITFNELIILFKLQKQKPDTSGATVIGSNRLTSIQTSGGGRGNRGRRNENNTNNSDIQPAAEMNDIQVRMIGGSGSGQDNDNANIPSPVAAVATGNGHHEFATSEAAAIVSVTLATPEQHSPINATTTSALVNADGLDEFNIGAQMSSAAAAEAICSASAADEAPLVKISNL